MIRCDLPCSTPGIAFWTIVPPMISARTSFPRASRSANVAPERIDAAVMGKLFQPFFTTKAGGTGLGLAISKRLIEEQGGQITVESSMGKGTTFRLIIPCSDRKGTADAEG